MLLLLTGPTGIGRTTVAFHGLDHLGWELMPTYTTRPQRTAGRDTKITVSEIPPVGARTTTYDDALYWTTDNDLDQAAAHPTPVVVCDYPHTYPEPFPERWAWALGVILVTEDATELGDRLVRAGRAGRVPRIAPELDRARSVTLPPRWHRVSTSRGPEATTKEITALIDRTGSASSRGGHQHHVKPC